MNRALFSSASEEWGTPQCFFDKLDAEFGFEIDVCASETNHKCKKFYKKTDNSLAQPWVGMCWCNPPYGRDIIQWVEKAIHEAERGAEIVMLLPSRTDTKWFHILFTKSFELRFVRGRLKFNDGKESAPFPSVIAVITPESVKAEKGRARCRLYDN